VAPLGSGRALRPVDIAGGARFAAFGLDPKGSTLALVLVPRSDRPIDVRVVIDSLGTATGARIAPVQPEQTTRIHGVGQASGLAPSAQPRTPRGTALSAPRETVRDGRVDRRDLDSALAAWLGATEAARCSSRIDRVDANGDGCLDVLDLQALVTAKGTRIDGVRSVRPSRVHRRAAGPAGVTTFTVNSAADTPDRTIGDGICATADGGCTLRAAIAEANALAGDDVIAFSLPGSAPVRIALTKVLPEISSRVGTLVIDGYTQPGSRANDAAFGTNAIPGVELYGAGATVTTHGLFVTSPGNTIRGLAFARFNKAIFLTGSDAHDNRVLGNWIGYLGNGANAGLADSGVVLDSGAHDNLVGTSNRADRNLIGNWRNGVDLYGAGTNRNIIRGNLLCIRPNGSPAVCQTAIDLDYGVKDTLIGGDGDGERNVVGPTDNQAVELSHAWDPTLEPGQDPEGRYGITGNRVVGNWLGFRADGSYDPGFRSGMLGRRNDNGNGVNVIDGPMQNRVERNVITALPDGIQVLGSRTRFNLIANNVIGLTRGGDPAPLGGWGIRVRLGSSDQVIEANRIANAAQGGIGLTHPSVKRTRITRNIVLATDKPAIDLYGIAGPDPNDPGDGDSGANSLLNTPIVQAATTKSVRGTGVPGATVEVYRSSRPKGYRGLPVEYLGTTTVGADGTWTLWTKGLSAGQRATALQILDNGTTSELAPNREVPAS
jgi:CSLREA domain-containing protein